MPARGAEDDEVGEEGVQKLREEMRSWWLCSSLRAGGKGREREWVWASVCANKRKNTPLRHTGKLLCCWVSALKTVIWGLALNYKTAVTIAAKRSAFQPLHGAVKLGTRF